MVNLYAIVRAGRTRAIRTRNGRQLKQIRSGPIAAVVREVTRPPAASPGQLRRYDREMRDLAEQFPAVLPARFATVMPADELMFILSSRRRDFQRALSHVRGKSQMTVRIVSGAATPQRRLAAAPHPDVPASGREYLRARARDAAAQRVVPGFEPVRKAVARWIRDERVEHRNGISTIYHLIPRASSTRYRQALQEAAADTALPAIVSGPWPPYAFTSR